MVARRDRRRGASDRRGGPVSYRATSATKLNFPLHMVAAIVAATLSASFVVWGTQSGIRESQSKIQSDVRDIITRMDAAERILAAESKTREALLAADTKLQQERLLALEKRLDDLERLGKLNDLEVRALREKVMGR